MSDIAIQVENLSKRYRIGRQEERPETLVGAALGWLKAPVDNFRQLRQLSRFQENGQEPDDIIWALKDVSFEVKRGEVVGIIGRNGAGKSTLLKILSRITEPTSGRVVLNGRVSSLLEVGTGFHPDLTGRENVYLNGAILGMTKQEIDRKFDEIVDFSGVERFIDTPVKRYSSGMQVRLAFAVAAHLEPEILLVDEVLAVGDAAFQKKCLGKMGEVAKEGRTVLFVSHNMAAIANLCNRCVYLVKGVVNRDGEPLLCVNHYMDDMRPSQDVKLLKHRLQKVARDPSCEIRSLEFIQGGQPTTRVVSHADIHVVIEYTVKQPVYGFRIGFDIIHENSGTVVFRSYHDDLAPSIAEMLPGAYRSEAVIPSNFLAVGNYRLSLVAGIHNVRWIVFDEIAFAFQVDSIKGINAHYADHRPGIVMPRIRWETTEIQCGERKC